MKKSLLMLLLLTAGGVTVRAEPPDPFASFEIPSSTKPASAEMSPFVKELATTLNWPADQLQTLERRGFGRTEMATFVAIAKKTSKPWAELIKAREKGATLRQMTEEAGLVYNDVFRESRRAKQNVENRLKNTAASKQ
ncbi:MAG TPA: hypothetical protein P5079_05180 [Elusimicrobiota bacterium]|nr:hypothetical protein [Elusimicrobiota bacterium]